MSKITFVRRHSRRGKTVKGHYRKRRSNLFRTLYEQEAMKQKKDRQMSRFQRLRDQKKQLDKDEAEQGITPYRKRRLITAQEIIEESKKQDKPLEEKKVEKLKPRSWKSYVNKLKAEQSENSEPIPTITFKKPDAELPKKVLQKLERQQEKFLQKRKAALEKEAEMKNLFGPDAADLRRKKSDTAVMMKRLHGAEIGMLDKRHAEIFKGGFGNPKEDPWKVTIREKRPATDTREGMVAKIDEVMNRELKGKTPADQEKALGQRMDHVSQLLNKVYRLYGEGEVKKIKSKYPGIYGDSK